MDATTDGWVGVTQSMEVGVPLTDGITVLHGPTRALGRFFLAAAAQALEAGAVLRLHDDLTTLVTLNAQSQASWGPLVPILHPGESELSSRNSFWISGQDANGRIIAAYAGRLLEVGPEGLGHHFRTLRLFYANPEPHLARGTTCEVHHPAADIADAITGRVAYAGGSWTDPAARGSGLAYLLTRVVRYIAYTRWDTRYTISTLRKDLATKGVLEQYGYVNQASGIQMRNGYRGDMDLNLIWMDRDWMDAELLGYVAGSALYRSRKTDAELTIGPMRDRQGSSSRS